MMLRRLSSILVTWIMLKVMLSLIAVATSSMRPVTDFEKAVPLSSVSLGREWAQRALVEPWQRWDALHYETIATRGYRKDDGTLQFQPLYPLLGRAASYLFGQNTVVGLLVVSNICGLLFLFVFHRLAELDLSEEDSRRAVLLFLHFPVAFILFIPYTEGLFLLLSALCFLMARRQSWWMAGALGGLASLTRQQGVFLMLPLAWELWESCGYDLRKSIRQWRKFCSLLLVPGGYVVWLVYRALSFNDISFDPASPQTWIYGLLISSDASRIVADQRFIPPWQVIAAALTNTQSTTRFDLVLGSVFLVMIVAGGRTLWKLRKSYFLYVCTILLVSFSFYTGSYQPYMGLPRHCLLAFPLFLPVAQWARRSRIETILITAGFIGMAFLTYCYTSMTLWLP